MDGEVIFITLFDVGRYYDLKGLVESGVLTALRATRAITRSKKVGYDIQMPSSLAIDLENIDNNCINNAQQEDERDNNEIGWCVKGINFEAKLYEEGVVSIIARMIFHDLPLQRFHELRGTMFISPIPLPGTNPSSIYSVDSCTRSIFDYLTVAAGPYLTRSAWEVEPYEIEQYAVYCIWDDVGDPGKYLIDPSVRKYLGTFLAGEDPTIAFNQDQVDIALSNPLSFLSNDLMLVDSDRMVIFDPTKDYEDVLLIAELANYQLLELRAIDQLLGKHLKQLESELRAMFLSKSRRWHQAKRKLYTITRLRIDYVFLLETIENVSNLIGDYFLAQVYSRMRELLYLTARSQTIRHRLEALEDIYDTAKADKTDRIVIAVEVGLAVIFIMEFVFLLVDFFWI